MRKAIRARYFVAFLPAARGRRRRSPRDGLPLRPAARPLRRRSRPSTDPERPRRRPARCPDVATGLPRPRAARLDPAGLTSPLAARKTGRVRPPKTTEIAGQESAIPVECLCIEFRRPVITRRYVAADGEPPIWPSGKGRRVTGSTVRIVIPGSGRPWLCNGAPTVHRHRSRRKCHRSQWSRRHWVRSHLPPAGRLSQP